jgi:hypothetical protein
MCKYLSKVIADFPEEITGVSAMPATNHLFKVREDIRKLNDDQADTFNHTVYQLLWECLTACKALSHANAKGTSTNDWVIRSLDD